MTAAHKTQEISGWFAEEALVLSTFHSPSDWPSLRIVLDASGASQRALTLTLASLLSGTAQRFDIQIMRPEGMSVGPVSDWIRRLGQVGFINGPEDIDVEIDLLLVAPVGVIFGRYSVEAAVEAKQVAGCELLRAVIDGSSGGLELWSGELLLKATNRSTAEAEVRKREGERWVSGSSLGLRYMGRPPPKQFLRKGAAGRLEQTVVVRDQTDQQTRLDYEERVRALQAELQRVRRIHQNGGDAPRTSRRIASLLRRGPKYVLRQMPRRFRELMKRLRWRT